MRISVARRSDTTQTNRTAPRSWCVCHSATQRRGDPAERQAGSGRPDNTQASDPGLGGPSEMWIAPGTRPPQSPRSPILVCVSALSGLRIKEPALFRTRAIRSPRCGCHPTVPSTASTRCSSSLCYMVMGFPLMSHPCRRCGKLRCLARQTDLQCRLKRPEHQCYWLHKPPTNWLCPRTCPASLGWWDRQHGRT